MRNRTARDFIAVEDLATSPFEQWAVIVGGKLLPIRFAQEHEALQHLADMIQAREIETT